VRRVKRIAALTAILYFGVMLVQQVGFELLDIDYRQLYLEVWLYLWRSGYVA
jgi:hypothetical protein